MTCSDCGKKNLTVTIATEYGRFCRACAFISDPKPKQESPKK